MPNLLKEASIVLTPTAYDNGKVLCVKPSEAPYGDFDFSRNSAATRVNSQGLVEDVQILSSNLVQNGSFSEQGSQEITNGNFSQQGTEQIVDGSFANGDADWNRENSVFTISDGVANGNGANGGSEELSQNFSQDLTAGKTYKVVFELLNYVSGSVQFVLTGGGSLFGTSQSADGTFTQYVVVPGNNNKIKFRGANFNGSITSISLVEVGQDWLLGTGWSIADNKAVCDGTNIAYLTQTGVLATGTSYRVQFDIVDYTSGSVKYRDNGLVSGQSFSGVGSYTDYVVAGGGQFRLMSENFIGSVTNISVKEVGQNWTLGTGWSIGDDKAIYDGTGGTSQIRQDGVVVIGKKYKLTLDVLANEGNGNNTIFLGGLQINTTHLNVGSYTFVGTTTSNASVNIYGRTGEVFEITNIKIIEITDDTNLPRINYEGFSYQDVLGSELVTNGGFDTGSANWLLGGTAFWVNSSIEIPTGYITQAFTLENNKTYRITFDVIQGSGINGGVYVNSSYNTNDFANNVGATTIGVGGTYTYTFTMNSQSNGITLTRRVNNQDIRIDNVSVKEYLGQEVVPDSGCGSWLWEPQSTNAIEYSNDYADSYWQKLTSGSGVAPIITSNYAISPDGTQNADRIQFDASTSGSSSDRSRIRATLTLTNGADYTFSFYAKSTNGTDQKISILFDNSQISVKTITSEWQRYEATATQTGTGSFCGLDLRSNNASTSDILVYGIQIEEQSYSTSLIPTDGTSVTRNKDVCTNGGTGTGLINSTEGVLYAEIAALATAGNNSNITLSDGTGNNRIYIYYLIDNSISVIYNVNSTGASINNFLLANITDQAKIAVRWGNSSVSVWINGVSVLSNTTSNFLPNTLNVLSFAKPAGGGNFYGKTKALAVFPFLTDTELAELTTI